MSFHGWMTSKTVRSPLHNPQSRHLRLQYVARSCSLSSPIKQRRVAQTISPQQIKFFCCGSQSFRLSILSLPDTILGLPCHQCLRHCIFSLDDFDPEADPNFPLLPWLRNVNFFNLLISFFCYLWKPEFLFEFAEMWFLGFWSHGWMGIFDLRRSAVRRLMKLSASNSFMRWRLRWEIGSSFHVNYDLVHSELLSLRCSGFWYDLGFCRFLVFL